jgi:hypothetical protein
VRLRSFKNWAGFLRPWIFRRLSEDVASETPIHPRPARILAAGMRRLGMAGSPGRRLVAVALLFALGLIGCGGGGPDGSERFHAGHDHPGKDGASAQGKGAAAWQGTPGRVRRRGKRSRTRQAEVRFSRWDRSRSGRRVPHSLQVLAPRPFGA